jgi:hypothetical protein
MAQHHGTRGGPCRTAECHVCDVAVPDHARLSVPMQCERYRRRCLYASVR